MPCYVCVHCGKCPIGGIKAKVTCAVCGTPLGPGISACPTCGADLRTAMRAKAADFGFSDPERNAQRFIAKGGYKGDGSRR